MIDLQKMKVSEILYWFSILLITIICCSGMSLLMPFRVYIIGIFGVCMYMWAIIKRKNILIHPISLAIVLFTIMIIVGIFFSLNTVETIKFGMVYLCLLPLLIFKMESQWLHKLTDFFRFTTLFVAVTIIINSLIPDLFLNKLNFLIRPGLQSWLRVEIESGFYSGIAGEKGEAATLMVIGVALGLGKLVKDEKITIVNLFYILITLIALMLPAKRTLFVIGCFFIVIYILGWTNKDKKAIAVAVCFLTLIICVIFSDYIPGAQILIERLTETKADESLNGRSYLWERAIQMYRNKPIFGYGYGSYNTFASYYGVRTSASGAWSFHAHNIYLQLLAEMGTIGFSIILFILFISSYFLIKLHNVRYKLKQDDKGLLIFSECMLTCYVLYGFTGNSLYSTNQLALFMVTLAYVIYLYRKYFPRRKNTVI